MSDEEVMVPGVADTPPVTPRVGQTVLYVRDDYSHLEGGSKSEPVTAVILAVHEDTGVTLNAQGTTVSPVSYDAGGATGTWHYPE